MSDKGNSVEWVETTEEVVIIEECLPPDDNNHTVIPILEPAKAPIQKLLDTVVPGENNDFCCEECLTLFQNQSGPTNISGPSFILDFSTAVGVLQRALLTLPFGLMIGRSSIPNAGIGVINHGPVLSPGMHFGPFEGEFTTRKLAMSSNFSWEIYKGENEYKYIDGAKETHSNWMRFVNVARNKEEANLRVVQYKGSILYHCCRTVHAGDELLVWPSSRMLDQFSEDWTQFWFTKLNIRESNTTASTQIFLCSNCQLSFSTETYLHQHIELFHVQPTEDSLTKQDEVVELHSPDANEGHEEEATVEPTVDPVEDSKTCPDCGKTFKQVSRLRRHKLCVHSNKRPYCCAHCKRSFSQASGLIRHQLVHKKQFIITQKGMMHNQNPVDGENGGSSLMSENSNPPETSQVDVSLSSEETVDTTENENTNVKEGETPAELDEQPKKCLECDKVFTYDAHLKRHVMTVHTNVRPYVCTLCQKGFRQHTDLARHLRWHKKQTQRLEINVAANDVSGFNCSVCAVNLPSTDDLKEHINNSHYGVVFVKSQAVDPVGNNQSPHESPQPEDNEEAKDSSPKPIRRPQRHEARSKIAALTKLLAPKRRKVQSCETNPESDEESCSESKKPNTANKKSTKKYKWYICNCCKHTYTNLKQLKTHTCTLKQHNGALKQHKCLKCGAIFNKSGFLKRHEQTAHSNANPSSCDRCGKVFATPNNLKQHQKSNSCEKYHCTSELFPCPFCQFSFTIKNYLIKHIRRHHPIEYLSHCEAETVTDLGWVEEKGEKLYKCSECEKSYASAQTLKNHTCLHQVKILYLCPDCGKGFTNKSSLKQHQRVHTGERPYSCPHCSKSFAHVGQLNVHLRTHTGEKPYLCTHCGESFRQSGDLKRHERKHTGVRPHSCLECGKSFSRPQSLKAHQMLHLGQRMFKCTQCGKSFSRNYHLRRHHQKMHL